MNLARTLLTLSLLASPGLVRGDETRTALVADGPTLAARLAGFEAGRVVLDDGRRRAVPIADLVQWGHPPELPERPLVVLADGSLLVAAAVAGDPRTLQVESDDSGPVDLPAAQVAGILFRPPSTAAQRCEFLDRIVSLSRRKDMPAADRAILANGDQLQGRIGRLDEQGIEIDDGAGPVRIERARLSAVAFAGRPAAPPQGLRMWIGTSEGSRLLARSVEPDGSRLRAVLLAGPAIRLALDDVVWLQPEGGRVTYLSDLPPAGYRHVPYLSLTWPYRADRSVTGTMLRAGGHLWAKGLGVHSAARLTYTLDEPYRRFQSEVAVDDQTAGGGSVRFRVFVDGHERYTSPTIRGADAPLPISVDVSGAKRLDLVVDFADRADQLDRADWLNARLVR